MIDCLLAEDVCDVRVQQVEVRTGRVGTYSLNRTFSAYLPPTLHRIQCLAPPIAMNSDGFLLALLGFHAMRLLCLLPNLLRLKGHGHSHSG